MKNYIVCWVTTDHGTDYRVFLERDHEDSLESAKEFYHSIRSKDSCWTANLTLIIESTDY